MKELTQDERERLARNLDRVRALVARATRAAGRDPGDVRLVAVTKSVDLPVIRALAELGQRDFGENRPERVPFLAEALYHAGLPARWHMIGHYQRRKVRRTLDFFHLVHSIHSEPLLATCARARARLLRRLLALAAGASGAADDEGAPDAAAQLELRREAEAVGLAAPLPVLLQVNVSGEATKQGFAPESVREVLAQARSSHPLLSIRGLMTMAPLGASEQETRRIFRGLAEIRRTLEDVTPLPELSMGMSGDFVTAVEEGATLVRVGSALFEGLNRV